MFGVLIIEKRRIAMTRDPVCNKQVDQNKASDTGSYSGQKYTFCGQDCKNKFDQEPERYVQSKQPQQQHEHAGRT
jgi:YHS domain-containing protein